MTHLACWLVFAAAQQVRTPYLPTYDRDVKKKCCAAT